MNQQVVLQNNLEFFSHQKKKGSLALGIYKIIICSKSIEMYPLIRFYVDVYIFSQEGFTGTKNVISILHQILTKVIPFKLKYHSNLIFIMF